MTGNARLEQNLKDARRHLVFMRERMVARRRQTILNSIDRLLMDGAVAEFYDALDRVWEAQCMAEGVFHA